MTFWLRFAFRSVRRRLRRTLITFISVGMGVAMLIVLGAIMVGVNDTMIKNAVALHSGNLVVESPPLPLKTAIAEATAWQQSMLHPAIDTYDTTAAIDDLLTRYALSLVIRNGEHVQAVQLQLVDPENERRRSPLPATLQAGQWFNDQQGLVIGDAVAKNLAVTVGEMVTIVTASQRFELPVAGIFHTGVAALDNQLSLLPTRTAQALNLEAAVRLNLAIFTKAGHDSTELKQQLQPPLGTAAKLYTWQEKLPEVEQLIKLNEFSMQIMILLVIAILAFGVANSLLISVMDRYRYYGILKAIGVPPRNVVITVIGEAVIICLGAGLIGTALGISASLIWAEIGLDISAYTSYNPHFSINAVIYPRLKPSMVLLPQALALITGVLASLWPAFIAARRQVSSSMRDL